MRKRSAAPQHKRAQTVWTDTLYVIYQITDWMGDENRLYPRHRKAYTKIMHIYAMVISLKCQWFIYGTWGKHNICTGMETSRHKHFLERSSERIANVARNVQTSDSETSGARHPEGREIKKREGETQGWYIYWNQKAKYWNFLSYKPVIQKYTILLQRKC